MQVRLLGPVAVGVGDVIRPVPGLRRKAVLAVLALHPGQIVSSDRLIDLVWGDRPPATAQNTLQRQVSYLRDALGGKSSIVARPPGYLLNLGTEATDIETAERLIGQARRADTPAERAAYLRQALALWRGQPLLDVAGLSWLDEQAERLTQTHDEVVRALVDTRLALGEHVDLIPELERLTAARLFDEDMHRLLMIALYRSGRQADALAAYQRLRRGLHDELGIDPSPPLRELEAAILRQDASLDHVAPAIGTVSTSDSPAAVAGLGPPAQLPLAVPAFSGRSAEIARLDASLARLRDGGREAGVVIVTLSGTAGVGKTSLAVHWSHRVRDHFPDGQLYVNLRGFDPGGSTVDPAVVLRGFLGAFGVAMDRIPASVDAQAALYRSVLHGRRVLVVLDNARDVEQVRPLLPGSPGCLVLVTSRNQLTALVTAEGAHPLTLALLTDDEARDLLAHRLGADRVAAEPQAIQEIIHRCARLPLALAIAAASCVTHPEFSAATMAAQLRDSTSPFDALTEADAGTDIAAVFSWSYQTLSDPAARLFRLLGLHAGPEITVAAATSVAGLPSARVRPLLAELTQANLLTRPSPGRYTFHDLLWTYARRLTHNTDDDAERFAAAHRLADHFLRTALAAGRLINPDREPLDAPPPVQAGTVTDPPDDRDEAVAWFAGERVVLIAATRRAADSGFDTHAWQLAWALQDFLGRWGHWEDQAVLQRVAVDAAGRARHLVAQARAHCGFATACAKLHRYETAYNHLGSALDLYDMLGDHPGQAFVHYQLSWLSNLQGMPQQALSHSRQALRLYRRAAHPVGIARTLNSLGWDHALCGDYARARSRCERALVELRQLGDRHFEAAASDSLGYIYHHLGDHDRAAEHYRHAVELFGAVGDRYYEADSLHHLGDTEHAAGRPAAAEARWRQALDIFDDLGLNESTVIRAKLDAVAMLARPSA